THRVHGPAAFDRAEAGAGGGALARSRRRAPDALDDGGGAMKRGAFLLEMIVALGVTGLLLGLLVPLYLHVNRASGALEGHARSVAAAREAAAQLRRDMQAAERVEVASDRLVLVVLVAEGAGRATGGVVRVTYGRAGQGWARRTVGGTGGSAPLWLRDEVRSLTFHREGRGVRAEIVCAAPGGRSQPVEVEVFAVPRNGGGRRSGAAAAPWCWCCS